MKLNYQINFEAYILQILKLVIHFMQICLEKIKLQKIRVT